MGTIVFNIRKILTDCYIEMANQCKISENFIWEDCEMTGLNLETDTLLEIAVVVTDKNLNILGKGPNIVIHHDESVLANMNQWCIEQHGKSGLTQKVRDSNISMKEAEEQIITFLDKWTKNGQCHVAGNSVGQDVKFIEKYMPTFMNLLHYRIIDVSAVKELCRRMNPEVFEAKPKKKMTHRALDDILESIDELKYYKNHFFITV